MVTSSSVNPGPREKIEMHLADFDLAPELRVREPARSRGRTKSRMKNGALRPRAITSGNRDQDAARFIRRSRQRLIRLRIVDIRQNAGIVHVHIFVSALHDGAPLRSPRTGGGSARNSPRSFARRAHRMPALALIARNHEQRGRLARANASTTRATVVLPTAGQSTGMNANPSASAGTPPSPVCSELNCPRSGSGFTTNRRAGSTRARIASA